MGLDAAVLPAALVSGVLAFIAVGVYVLTWERLSTAQPPPAVEKSCALELLAALVQVNPLLVSNLSCCSDIIIGSEFAVWGVGRVRL